ncbi:MAG: GGDEF domain-containing protein [Cyanobacteria bacterium P01_A01_bin.17]
MKPKQTPDFLRKSSLGLAIVCLVFLTPFAINNFIQGRYLLGAGSLALIAIFIFNTWTITRYDRYYDSLTLLGLVPAILFFLITSLRSQGIIGVLWCYPAVASFYLLLPERKAWMANVALLIVTLPVAWPVIDQTLAVRMMVTLIMVSIFLAIFVRVINEQQYELKLQAATDPMTGLLNRTLLQETLEQATAQSQRTGVAMTLAALDIDHFKSINDTFGHAAGDQVLCSISQLLKGRVRRVDRVFRLGGEELLVLLYGTGKNNGSLVAEELRKEIAALELLPNRPVTVSIGLATLHPQEDWKLWMQRSDENLYQAKAMGRNRVVT